MKESEMMDGHTQGFETFKRKTERLAEVANPVRYNRSENQEPCIKTY